MKNKRTIEQAMKGAAQLKAELPHLIQPSSADYDRVVLFDFINKLGRRNQRLRKMIESLAHAAD